MKTIKLLTIFTLFFAAFNLTSCATGDEPVDPAVLTGPNPATFTAQFDGATFTATTVQAAISDGNLSITGVKASGEFFQITIPEVRLGTYKWADFGPTEAGFALAYSSGSGSVPFIGARDDSGTFASFSNYTDTAEISITSLDEANKKVSGTFHFTGVKYQDGSVTAVVTKEFTNGAFTNVSYGEPDVPSGANFSAKVDGATFTPTSVTALKTTFSGASSISIGAVKGSETISLNMPGDIAPGTYSLSTSGTIGQYIKDSSATGSFVSSSGTLVISSHNVGSKKIIGTFSFTASPVIPPTTTTHQITQGSFNLTYL